MAQAHRAYCWAYLLVDSSNLNEDIVMYLETTTLDNMVATVKVPNKRVGQAVLDIFENHDRQTIELSDIYRTAHKHRVRPRQIRRVLTKLKDKQQKLADKA